MTIEIISFQLSWWLCHREVTLSCRRTTSRQTSQVTHWSTEPVMRIAVGFLVKIYKRIHRGAKHCRRRTFMYKWFELTAQNYCPFLYVLSTVHLRYFKFRLNKAYWALGNLVCFICFACRRDQIVDKTYSRLFSKPLNSSSKSSYCAVLFLLLKYLECVLLL